MEAEKRVRSIDRELTVWTWIYDFVVWTFQVIFDLFFREILPRGAFRVPKQGPVIFVGAPHANQFVDPMILMQLVRNYAGRRISFLVAEKSTHRKFIGFISKSTQAIGVVRAQDNLRKASGEIFIDFEANPLVVKGKGTQFTKECMVRGLIGLPQSMGNVEISEIVSDTELVLRKEFKGAKAIAVLKRGTAYKVAEHVDQSLMYHRVFEHLHNGGCLGIFPEGGSHDRPDLLPLKAGVAIMALGALAEKPDTPLKIVPCGMNYFHAHKFRSRAVIEFGTPLEINPVLIAKYQAGGDQKREAVKEVLDMIADGLRSVTVRAPDYETLMVIQAARRLYRPSGKKLPLPVNIEMSRRLLNGYDHYKDDPAIVHLKEAVMSYNKRLRQLGIKDHHVETASMSPQNVVFKLVYRLGKLMVLAALSLPGAVLFSPVFVATKLISKKKAAEALEGSTVKIAAMDVVATWKVLVAMVAAPLLYTVYAILATFIAWKRSLVPNTWTALACVWFGSFLVFPSLTYSALIMGETGMDIFKSLRPLALAMNPSQKNTVEELRETRHRLVSEITELVNSLGPALYPDFNRYSIVKGGTERTEEDEELITAAKKAARARKLARRDSAASEATSESNAISRVNSLSDLANIPIFSSGAYHTSTSGSSAPSSVGTPSSASDVEDITSTSASGQKAFQTEVSRRIRDAMSEKRQQEQEQEDEDEE
ncbi:glycerol-3-phosphate O-acyltransferase 1 [Trichomonascus vanleenenianus]|uniref:bifunctional glycerol-3-phosphate/glycerone-phosphate O-acyltransferase GPT2 n=1 Tax=Trichomonascus vanleenenianus TaxID=2268995 RepID=UPI003EC99350